MPRKCPPGVFCIDNITLFVLLSIVLLIAYMGYNQYTSSGASKPSTNTVIIKDRQNDNPLFTNPNYLMSQRQGEIYLNPYAPPLKHNFFFPPSQDVRGGVPINTPTSHYDFNYRQIGILTRNGGAEQILALFGRPLHANRNKWQYYTMTDKHNAIKLPVSKDGRSCTGEYGCDEIFNGDSIYVEGYNDAFTATVYESGQPRYIPFL